MHRCQEAILTETPPKEEGTIATFALRARHLRQNCNELSQRGVHTMMTRHSQFLGTNYQNQDGSDLTLLRKTTDSNPAGPG
jgi:hypothetical protein